MGSTKLQANPDKKFYMEGVAQKVVTQKKIIIGN